MKDFIEIGGTEYRVEVNWNAIGDFLDVKGYDLTELSKVGAMKVADMTTLLWCSIVEGERLEGREFKIAERDLGAMIGPSDLKSFIEVFSRYFSSKSNATGGDSVKKKNNRWFTKK